jgi:hypothetical protein
MLGAPRWRGFFPLGPDTLEQPPLLGFDSPRTLSYRVFACAGRVKLSFFAGRHACPEKEIPAEESKTANPCAEGESPVAGQGEASQAGGTGESG